MTPHWLINAFGVTAGLCSIVSFCPQLIKLLRERDASGVSTRMYAITCFGFVCWTTYGWLSGSWPVALSNTCCLLLAGAILFLKLRIGDTHP